MNLTQFHIEKKLETLQDEMDKHFSFSTLVVATTIINFSITFFWVFQSGSDPEMDFVSLSLTIFQMFFAVLAVAGFWIVRGTAKRSAQEAAIEHVNKELMSMIEKEITRTLQKYLETLQFGGDSQEMQNLIDSIDGEENK